MNAAHLHLILNHFPIIGTIFGFVLLFVGIFWKNTTIRKIGHWVFVVAFAFALASNFTGHSAEKVIERLPDIDKSFIEQHEDFAKIFLWLSGILAVFSIIVIAIEIRLKKSSIALNIIVLIWALFVIYFSTMVGESGGKIRHSEIRSANSTPAYERKTIMTMTNKPKSKAIKIFEQQTKQIDRHIQSRTKNHKNFYNFTFNK